MRVLVCGGRDYNDETKMRTILQDYIYGPEDVLISGAARGADSLAAKLGSSLGAYVIEFPADWNKHGRSAGPIRNKQMLDEGMPDIVLAFPGGRGTQNMIQQSRKAGVEVVEIE